MKSLVYTAVAAVICLAGCETSPDAAGQALKDTSIKREVATPSGDWIGTIDYQYGVDGNLRHVSYEFRTLSGYDAGTEEFSPTRCVRRYDISATGELILKSKVTTDLSTGDPVERTFYEPEITHWMSLAEAQENIQAEQDAAPKP